MSVKTALLKTSTIVTAFVLAAPYVGAQSAPPAEFNQVVARLQAAALADDAAGVKEARLSCLRLLATAKDPASIPLLRYSVAYAGWRVAFSPNVPAGERASLVDDAEVQLKEAIKLHPKFAEALGLLAAVYGAKIAMSPDLGMTLGMQAGVAIASALALEPANPRLLLLQGTNLFHTPPEYGGSVKEAEAIFRRALQLFEQEGTSKAWPNWGRFDAHAWLGQALLSRGDKAGARAEYEKALAIAPDSKWVRYALLPQVK